MRNKIKLFINAKEHLLDADKAQMMLADYLRYDQCLTGTKVVCAEGDCGACSVLRFFPTQANVNHYQAINSCITPVAILDGSSLITVDALKEDERFHEAQRTMIEHHGSQCGFCTPGFVVALGALVDEKLSKKGKSITKQEAKNALTGNLCRCTGYEPIIDAAVNIKLSNESALIKRFMPKEQKEQLKKTFDEAVLIQSENYSFYAPKTVAEACDYLSKNNDCRIMASSTDLGVVYNKRKAQYSKVMSLHLVSELYEITKKKKTVSVGARVTIEEFRLFLRDDLNELSSYLDIFASPQIKNIATLIGNIANASPIGDTAPTLMVLDAKIFLNSVDGERVFNLDEFFLDYRKTQLKKNELITRIEFEIPDINSDYRFTKNSNRKDLDISAVNFAIHAKWKDKKNFELENILIAAGGIAATPLKLKKTEQALKGKKIDKKIIDEAIKELHTEFSPLSDVRATNSYRRMVIENYFKRFFIDLGVEL